MKTNAAVIPYEKKHDRLELPKQLWIGAALGREIRKRAEINDRTIQGEILHLLKAGLKADPLEERA